MDCEWVPSRSAGPAGCRAWSIPGAASPRLGAKGMEMGGKGQLKLSLALGFLVAS